MTHVSQPPEELHELVHHLILTYASSPARSDPALLPVFTLNKNRSTDDCIVCTSPIVLHATVLAPLLLQPPYARWLQALRGAGAQSDVELALKSCFPSLSARHPPQARTNLTRAAHAALPQLYALRGRQITTQEVSRRAAG